MSSITVRNLPEETHRALRLRAAMAGRSTEAEVRTILESAARPEGRVKLVSRPISLRHTEMGVAPFDQGAKRSNSRAIASICNEVLRDARHVECSEIYRSRH